MQIWLTNYGHISPRYALSIAFEFFYAEFVFCGSYNHFLPPAFIVWVRFWLSIEDENFSQSCVAQYVWLKWSRSSSKTHIINTSYSFCLSIIAKVFACVNLCNRSSVLYINCINCTLLATATKTICGKLYITNRKSTENLPLAVFLPPHSRLQIIHTPSTLNNHGQSHSHNQAQPQKPTLQD